MIESYLIAALYGPPFRGIGRVGGIAARRSDGAYVEVAADFDADSRLPSSHNGPQTVSTTWGEV